MDFLILMACIDILEINMSVAAVSSVPAPNDGRPKSRSCPESRRPHDTSQSQTEQGHHKEYWEVHWASGSRTREDTPYHHSSANSRNTIVSALTESRSTTRRGFRLRQQIGHQWADGFVPLQKTPELDLSHLMGED